MQYLGRRITRSEPFMVLKPAGRRSRPRRCWRCSRFRRLGGSWCLLTYIFEHPMRSPRTLDEGTRGFQGGRGKRRNFKQKKSYVFSDFISKPSLGFASAKSATKCRQVTPNSPGTGTHGSSGKPWGVAKVPWLGGCFKMCEQANFIWARCGNCYEIGLNAHRPPRKVGRRFWGKAFLPKGYNCKMKTTPAVGSSEG